ncbi:hypothetical protein [Bacillus smithii]|nr:hypothetical protein [Bacillus smithii]
MSAGETFKTIVLNKGQQAKKNGSNTANSIEIFKKYPKLLNLEMNGPKPI